MSRTWHYAAVPVLLGSLMLQLGFAAPESGARPLGSATSRKKVTPEVRAAQHQAARLALRVQLRPRAKAKDYMGLWTAGARIVERDYTHSTAGIILPSRKLPALAALPQVQAIRLDSPSVD